MRTATTVVATLLFAVLWNVVVLHAAKDEMMLALRSSGRRRQRRDLANNQAVPWKPPSLDDDSDYVDANADNAVVIPQDKEAAPWSVSSSREAPPPPSSPDNDCPKNTTVWKLCHSSSSTDSNQQCPEFTSCRGACLPSVCEVQEPYGPEKIPNGLSPAPSSNRHFVNVGSVCKYMAFARDRDDTWPRDDDGAAADFEVCCQVGGGSSPSSSSYNHYRYPGCVGCDECAYPQTINAGCCAYAHYGDNHDDRMAEDYDILHRNGEYEGCTADPELPDCCKCGQNDFRCIPRGGDCEMYCDIPPTTVASTTTSSTVATTTSKTTTTTTTSKPLETTSSTVASTTSSYVATTSSTVATTSKSTSTAAASTSSSTTTTSTTTTTTSPETTTTTSPEDTECKDPTTGTIFGNLGDECDFAIPFSEMEWQPLFIQCCKSGEGGRPNCVTCDLCDPFQPINNKCCMSLPDYATTDSCNVCCKTPRGFECAASQQECMDSSRTNN